jgi:alkyl hydroperoxide reductase subunit F
MIFDLLIIGGGPAGVAAGVYAARKKLKTLFVTFDFGGQSQVSAEIQNWIGTKAISGEKLAADLKDHLLSYQGPDLTVKTGLKIQSVLKKDGGFVATADSGESFEAKTVLVTTGADRRRLEVPGAKEFDQKGITYCATCDGPLFADQDVVVIGGGNAAFESTAQLAAYCKSVTILHRSDSFRADAITVEKVKSKPNVKIITNAEVQEFKGEKFLKSLVYKNTVTGDSIELATTGVFVEIGLVPTTWFIKDTVTLNDYGQIMVDPRTQRASTKGIWAAGDCTDGIYHQNNIAAGDAIKALEDIYSYLHLQAN